MNRSTTVDIAWLITYKQERTTIDKTNNTIDVCVEEITTISYENPIKFWFKTVEDLNKNREQDGKVYKFKIVILYSFEFYPDSLSPSEFQYINLDQIILTKWTKEEIATTPEKS